MTVSAITRPWDQPIQGDRLRPAEGWITVGAVILLVESFVWALQDAAWVPDSQGSTANLFFLALVAIFIELVGIKAGWGHWKTHLVAGVIGGLVLPYVAAVTVLGVNSAPVDWTDVAGLYRVSGTIAFNVWADLVRDGKPFTDQFGHYHMVFGGIVWAAAMLATSAVFQRRRPFDAVVVVGILLITNISITAKPELPYLVVFSVAALVLLVRAHSFEEQVTWARRRIGDPSAVSALYLRGGASFVSVAVVGALILTFVASSAPLQGMWADIPSRLAGLSDILQRYAPGGGEIRGIGAVGFTETTTLTGNWTPADGIAFTAKVAPGSFTDDKWLAGTYSVYDGSSRWTWGDTQTSPVQAGQDVLAGSADDPVLDKAARKQVSFTITPTLFKDGTVLSPAMVETVSKDATLRILGDGSFTTLDRGNSDPYDITALVLDRAGGAITENRLRASPRTYPDDIVSNYTFVKDGVLGPRSLQIYTIVQGIASTTTPPDSPSNNPYDFTKDLETYLRGGNFQYQANIVDDVRADCDGISSVECFATIHRGYCEYYATFMAILLRHDGIPSRIAYGYLRGQQNAATQTETVMASNAHWWVQAYFAGYGWVDFDPTGGGVGQEQFIESGPQETLGPPSTGGPRTSHRPGEPDDRTFRPPTGGGASSGGRGGAAAGTGVGPFIVIGALLLVALLVMAFTARRRPRVAMDPDSAWGGLGRLASRFGFGPRPAQTVYEYAGALADAVPAMRAELETVARAKVEVAYGRQSLPVDRLRAVADAYRRLQLAIVRRGLARFGRRR
jgi:transglutaminase-like putative cysteine protease